MTSYIGQRLGAVPLGYNQIPYCHPLAKTLGNSIDRDCIIKFENKISRCVRGRKGVKFGPEGLNYPS